MKKQLLIPLLLTFCSFQSFAQFRIDAVDNSDFAKGKNNPMWGVPTTTTIIGNGSYAAPRNVFVGNNTGTSSIYAPLDPTGNDGTGNTFVGYNCGTANLNGIANAFFGMWSGVSNTIGRANTFLGQWSGPANTEGSHNVMVGQASGQVSTTGYDNTFVGEAAAPNNISGNRNVFVGRESGIGNTTGSDNIAIGYNAGFSAGGLNKATAIGANAVCHIPHAIILGTETLTTPALDHVKVGIGTGAPNVHLHTFNDEPENVRFETNSTANNSASTLDLNTSSISLKTAMNAPSNTNNLLPSTVITTPSTYTIPAIPLMRMGTMLTNGNAVAIGRNDNEVEQSASLHFVTHVANTNAGTSFFPAECMRVNQKNGFVGVHTRTSGTAGATTSNKGEPQTLFHVNLTNPVITDLDPLTQGIRFEGLPQANHDSVIVIDHDGNLAKAPYIGAPPPPTAWLLTGNNSVTPTDYIGTNNNEDFRIKTNAGTVPTVRARFDVDGNFILGTNPLATPSYITAIVGTANHPDGATSSILVGTSNLIQESFFSATFGDDNTITGTVPNPSTSCQATGKQNIISLSHNVLAAGEINTITQSSSSFASGSRNNINVAENAATLGIANVINNSKHSQALGTDNIIDHGSANVMSSGATNNTSYSTSSQAMGTENYISVSENVMASGFTDTITNSTSSQAMGARNMIDASDYVLAAGQENKIYNAIAVAALGKKNVINSGCNESVVAGEENTLNSAHGCFIGGGHNTTTGGYAFVGGNDNKSVGTSNVLIGNYLETNATLMTPVSPLPDKSIMIMGENIHSDLYHSLTVGFNANRTMVVQEQGVAIQLDPKGTTTLGTYIPTVNFEVNASPTGAAPLPPCPLNSNIRFHNLPVATNYPAVIVNPLTGELFMSTTPQAKPGDNSSEDITILQKENEELKNRLSQLESMLSKYDDKFAQLEKSIYEICEKGCAGLNTHLSDDLYQSIPNPSSTEANIGYYLANNYNNASIVLVNIEGKVMRTFNLNPSRGNGSINVPLSELQPGVYMYKLVVDGKQIGAKKLQKQ